MIESEGVVLLISCTFSTLTNSVFEVEIGIKLVVLLLLIEEVRLRPYDDPSLIK